MPRRTGRPWQRVKARIIARDGGRCHLCGDFGADTADHLVPVSKGGPVYDDDNLAAAHHWPCNQLRQDRPIGAVRGEIAAMRAAGEWPPKRGEPRRRPGRRTSDGWDW